MWRCRFALKHGFAVFAIPPRRTRKKFAIFAYGILIGAIVEVIGTQISGYQSFAKPDFGGIPMWLPIVWGYGFVAMKRIGFVLKDLCF